MKKSNKPARWWFRTYNEAAYDPKLQRLSDKQHRFLFHCWCLASEHGGCLPCLEDVATVARLSDEEAATLIKELQERQLLDTRNGHLMPHNWTGRQFHSDTSTERVRKHRMKRNETPLKRNETKKEQNLPFTSSTQSMQIQPIADMKRFSNIDVTHSESESESEYKAAAIKVPTTEPPPPPEISQPADLPPPVRGGNADVSLKEQEIVATCAPVTFRLGSPLTPGIIGSILQNLNGAPVSFLADRIKERGHTAKTLGFLAELAKDACEQSRMGIKKPPKPEPPKRWEPDWILTEEDRKRWEGRHAAQQRA